MKSSRKIFSAIVFLFSIALIAGFSKTSYAKTGKLRILICGYEGRHASERKMLEKYGFKVTVGCPQKINMSKWDGLVIPGSKKNITPKLYGEKKGKYTNKGDIKLDKDQIRITRQFIKAKKPILGICRGCQMINVVFGGTLIQHIGASRGGEKSGRWAGYHRGTWKIRLKKDSWLYKKFGNKVSVKHSHHQCVGKLGKGIIPTQWDTKSGLIEGIEHESLPIYGLQWHPDLMKGKVPKVVCMQFKKIVLNEKKVSK